jgi:hypothetical protein
VLYPGDGWAVGEPHDPEPALRRFDAVQAGLDELPYDSPQRVELTEIERAFASAADHFHERYPRAILGLLQPVSVRVPDLDLAVRFSIARRSFETIADGEDTDLIVRSQPLHFAFRWPWGVQTLGVSARYFIRKNHRNWRRHRILFSLNNSELYLKPKYFFTRQTFAYLRTRLQGGPNQLLGKLRRMR